MSIAVLPEYRNLGIASNMIKEILKIIRENDFLRIDEETSEKNEFMIKIFEKFGFIRTGRIEYYYPDGAAYTYTLNSTNK